MTHIASIHAREILDSRGHPTLEVDVRLDDVCELDGTDDESRLAVPMFNVLDGGAHADSSVRMGAETYMKPVER